MVGLLLLAPAPPWTNERALGELGDSDQSAGFLLLKGIVAR